nr:FGGY-family carbohydrate kinase [Vibrio sp. MEBiC08052]
MAEQRMGHNTMSYFLGIDSGGTVLKAGLFDCHGRQIALYRENTQVIREKQGWIERDLSLYWQETCRAIQGVIKQSGIRAEQIRGLSISAQGKGLYLLDKDGKALRHGILSSDSRAIDIVRQWQQDGIPEAIYPLTRQTLWTGHPVSILRWVKMHEPHLYAQIGTVFMSHDYLRYCLTGEIRAEVTNMSESNFYHASQQQYDPALLSLFGIEEVFGALPKLIYPAECSGMVNEAAAQATGLMVGTPVYGGLFDVVSTAICSGIHADQPMLNAVMGTWSVTSGITTTLETHTDEPFVYGHYAMPGAYIVHEASPTSASNYEWFAPYLGGEQIDHQENERLVSSLNPLASDVLFVPFLYGSNAGLGLKGSFYGLQAYHSKAHLIQAIWLGIVCCHHVHLQKMLRRFPETRVLRVTGGTTQSPTWMQMLADLTGLRLEIPAVEETGALGAALVSMVGSGTYPDLTTALAASDIPIETVLPNPDLYASYQSRFERYQRYVEALKNFEEMV